MNVDKLDHVQNDAADSLASKFEAMKEHAEHFIHRKMEGMVDEGEAFALTDDEERLLTAYRGFKSRSMPGAVFSWTTPTDSAEIVVPATPSLIHDPRDVSQVR